MSTHRHIDLLCIAAVLLALVLTALFCCGQALGIGIITDGDAEDGQFTKNDLNDAWDTSGATRITLTGAEGKVSGNGAYLIDGDVHIVYAGKYVLSGELADGSIIVDADGDDKVWILLDGVSVHCSDGAALRVEQAKKVFLTLADGTENTFSDGGTYSEALTESGVDGAVYSRDDLTINGSGTLTVNGAYRHGIVCNDDLVITGGTLVINAAKDGIHANDSVRFAEADLTVSAGDDGITVSNDEGTGYLYIASGSISIPACYEGLEGSCVTIDGGAIDIVPTDDGINASGRGSGSAICINGGTVRIVNPTGRDADGLDSNGDIFLNGGELFISVNGSGGSSAIDYGSENGGICRISGGTVIACGGSAMLEAIDSDSPQAFLMYAASGAADTDVSLANADGTVLLSATVPCPFSSVVFSVPELRLGDSCTVTVGETAETVVIDNTSAVSAFAPDGGFGGFGGMHGQGGNGGGGRGNRDAWTGNGGGTPEMPGGTENGENLPGTPGNGEPGQGMAGRMPGQGNDAGRPEMPAGGEPSDEMSGMPGMPFAGENSAGPPLESENAAPEAPLLPDSENGAKADGLAPDNAPSSFGGPNEPIPGSEPDAEAPFPQSNETETPPAPVQAPESGGERMPETGEQRPDDSDRQGENFGGFGGMDMDGGRGTDGGRGNRPTGRMQAPGTPQNTPAENTAGASSPAALPLTGISALSMLLGLLIAAKVKGKYESF